MKICPMRVELFHADRWTTMSKVTVAFRKFAKAPKNREEEFPFIVSSVGPRCFDGNKLLHYTNHVLRS